MTGLNLFGWEIRKSKTEKEEQKQLVSFTPEYHDDGATIIPSGGSYGTSIDLTSSARTESELVTKYRAMSLSPELEPAIDEIVNEAIVVDDENKTVEIVLDDMDKLEIPETVKDIISDEFQNILDLLEFDTHGWEIFRRWYIDGRLNYHVMIDKTNVLAGIKQIRYIDPRNIKKIREIKKTIDPDTKVINITTVAEYYVYNEAGFSNKSRGPITTSDGNNQYGVRIAKDAICYITSGLMDENNNLVLSYLNKAIKPLNQLSSLEDSSVIYRMARGPERRIWYVDVGNLPKMKAEQYMEQIMNKHKNRVTYDSDTGNIRDERKFTTVLEDYWIPRFAGGRGTEIDTLPGAQNLGDIDDILYFNKKLYKALNVPASRIDAENSMYTLGRATEISRDEIKFAKFIRRLRMKFSMLFTKLLEKQLILKNIVTHEEWVLLKDKIKYRFNKDSYFEELKNTELLNERLTTLEKLIPFVGRYFSNEYVRKYVLYQDDEDMADIDAQIELEKDIPQYNEPIHPYGMQPVEQGDVNQPGEYNQNYDMNGNLPTDYDNTNNIDNNEVNN